MRNKKGFMNLLLFMISSTYVVIFSLNKKIVVFLLIYYNYILSYISIKIRPHAYSGPHCYSGHCLITRRIGLTDSILKWRILSQTSTDENGKVVIL